MKKVSNKFMNAYNLILGALLTAIGFLSSCQEIPVQNPKLSKERLMLRLK